MISLKQIKKYIQNLLSGKFLLEENKLTDDIILFLCSGDALPSPLDSETELEYIEKAEVSDIEINRTGKSYTVDTLRQLKNLYPQSQLFLIMGEDMFLSLLVFLRCIKISFSMHLLA